MKKVLVNVFLAIFLFQALSLNAQNYEDRNTLPGIKKVREEPGTERLHGSYPALEEVIIVYKTHFDIGYSETIQQVLHDYRTSMADRVLEAIELNRMQPKEKQFVWTLSGWPMKQMLWEGQAPWRKKQMEQAISDGRLIIHAFPFTMHVESSEAEDLVRGLHISSTLARKYGKALSISAKMTDVPGQPWILPTLFTHAGIKFYHMGGPVVNKRLGLPPFFWWEGPDGSRLLTLYNNAYGTPKLPPEGWPHRTWMHISMTGDNQGPPDPETVTRDMEFYEDLGLKARVGSMDDFAESILKEDLSAIPVVRSDIGDVWIHGLMSRPEGTKLARNIRPSIGGLDKLTTLESLWGIHQAPKERLVAEAYEQSLLYSEHTWGLANQHYLKTPYGKDWQELWERGLPPQYKLMEKSWRDHTEYARNVQDLVEDPYQDAVSTLADHVDVRENRIVVYNPLPWPRDGELVVDTRLFFGNDFVSLREPESGENLVVSHEYPAVEDQAPVSRFVARNIPPMGYRSYVASRGEAEPAKVSAHAEEGVIESPFFKVTLDPEKGRIISLIDKRSGRELVDAQAPQGFGQYLYERFGYQELSGWIDKSLYPRYLAHRYAFVAYDMPRDVPFSSALPEKMTLTVETSAIDVRAVMTGTISGSGQPQKISISVTLSGLLPTVDLEISWQKQPDTWPEAAWICLPFKLNNPQYRLGRIGAEVDPAKDMITDNANYHLWWVNHGLAIFDGESGAGVGICSPDVPLVSLGEPGEYKFDQRFTDRKPYVYLNLYNNHWRTNFSSWIGRGQRMSARVRLWTFDSYSTGSSLFTPAMETREPLLVAASKVKSGTLPYTREGISFSRKGIALSAFGPNPDGQGLILRLWEQAGKSGSCTVKLPEGLDVNSLQPVDLRGRPLGEAVEVKEREFEFFLKAYAPATFLIQ